MFGSTSGFGGTSNPNGDMEVQGSPDDGVSSVSWSPVADYLAATSWDNSVRIWEVNASGAPPKAMQKHEQPVLCSCWAGDGTKVFSGGCDNQVKMWDLASNQMQQVAAHHAPVKEVKHIPEMNMLVTGSWDKSLRYWDCRQANPVHTENLPERVYALDVKHPLLVCGTADRKIIVVNLQMPQKIHKVDDSPLKWQTRCVACFPDKSGFLVGSIEGRVGVHHVDAAQASNNFTFKCHRQDANEGSQKVAHIFAINGLSFSPQYGTFATCGADGAYNFWDKDARQRLKAFKPASQSISCCSFNRDGNFFAYAISYDWHQGYSKYNPQVHKNTVCLRQVQKGETERRPTSRSGSRR